MFINSNYGGDDGGGGGGAAEKAQYEEGRISLLHLTSSPKHFGKIITPLLYKPSVM